MKRKRLSNKRVYEDELIYVYIGEEMKIKKLIVQLGFIYLLGISGCNTLGISVAYNFENSSMEQEEQENYMTRVKCFLDKVNKYGRNNELEELTIYVEDATADIYQEKEWYINTSETESLESYFKLFLAINGEDGNAGEAYGLTVQLYEECGIGIVEKKHTEEELAAYFSDAEHLYLLDFTLPMLETYYFDEETAQYVQDAAMDFVEYCIDEYGMSKAYRLCMDASEKGHEKLVKMKNDWLVEIGGTATYEEYGKLPFSYNYAKETEAYPYVIREENANWYFSPIDVQDVGYCTFITEYSIVAPVAEADFAEAKEVLKAYIPEEVKAVDIFTEFYEAGKGKPIDGYYSVETDAIWECMNWRGVKASLLHEYVHYLTMGDNKIFKHKSGLMEGVTEEIAILECENNLNKMQWENLNEEEYAHCKENGLLDLDSNQLNLKSYLYYSAASFYNWDGEDLYYSIAGGYTIKPEIMTMSALPYEAAASMSKYLMEQYGMEQTFAYCTDVAKLQQLTGKSFEELYEDWGKWNEQKYQEMKIE